MKFFQMVLVLIMQEVFWRYLFWSRFSCPYRNKTTSSIRKNRNTVDKDGRSTEISTTGRHDPCVGIRATPIGEAMIAIVLMDHALRDRGQNKR